MGEEDPELVQVGDMDPLGLVSIQNLSKKIESLQNLLTFWLVFHHVQFINRIKHTQRYINMICQQSIIS